VAIAAQDVKRLREKTGAGMMDCKNALRETSGDFDEAVKLLREKGLADAKKRSGREANEGIITVSFSPDRSRAVMIEVNCETDFVARTDKFSRFVQETADSLLERKVEERDAVPPEIEESVREAAGAFGENILLRRMCAYAASGEKTVLQSYIHLGGKVGVLVEFSLEGEDSEPVREFMKNVSLQIASMEPISVSPGDMPGEVVQEQREIFMKQARESGKPDKILDKIVDGRMKKFFSESCLLEQKYVKDSDLSIDAYRKSVEKENDVGVGILRFTRFKLGED
jgi:elongation factor Ts